MININDKPEVSTYPWPLFYDKKNTVFGGFQNGKCDYRINNLSYGLLVDC